MPPSCPSVVPILHRAPSFSPISAIAVVFGLFCGGCGAISTKIGLFGLAHSRSRPDLADFGQNLSSRSDFAATFRQLRSSPRVICLCARRLSGQCAIELRRRRQSRHPVVCKYLTGVFRKRASIGGSRSLALDESSGDMRWAGAARGRGGCGETRHSGTKVRQFRPKLARIEAMCRLLLTACDWPPTTACFWPPTSGVPAGSAL